ncbi:MAG TPA: hypothetical protein ENN17_07400 [bacterium]|nr:hypothetical protein [bacterium]
MAKTKTFADKLQKATHDYTTHCPECGESFVMVKLIRSEKSEKTEAWRFRKQFVGICKCNTEKITG